MKLLEFIDNSFSVAGAAEIKVVTIYGLKNSNEAADYDLLIEAESEKYCFLLKPYRSV